PWARSVEQLGIHVVTGLVNLKTHAKIALVVRRRGGRIRRYAHVGTGNYNPDTARVYSDLGLFTAEEDLGADLNALFNELTGSSRPPQAEFRRLLVAPTNMLRRFLDLIEREAEHARAGRGGRIRVKLNGLADGPVIAALYRASQAGASVELVVRGICMLRPGVPGLSERIRVTSILGRFLEHARIYHFENGGAAEYYIGSADWRPRNLRRRIEVAVPVRDAAARAPRSHPHDRARRSDRMGARRRRLLHEAHRTAGRRRERAGARPRGGARLRLTDPRHLPHHPCYTRHHAAEPGVRQSVAWIARPGMV